jgi:uncharacterized protein (TIGR03000 family)
MRRRRLAAAILIAAGALLLAPSAGRAQGRPGEPWDIPPNFYGPGALSWPGAYSFTQRTGWYGYNWPYKGYYTHHYEGMPYQPRGGPQEAAHSERNPVTESSSYYDYGARPGSEGGTARVKVTLPDAGAQVWFEGQLTQQRGTQRGFVSPRLGPGQEYVYDVRARWTENGRAVEQTRTVRVRADGVATVDFTASAR